MTRKAVPLLGGLLLGASLLILHGGSGRALPRYAAVYGQDCALCHMNPSGGGMRGPYATEMLIPEELARERISGDAGEALKGLLGGAVSLGADLRTLLRYSADETRRNENNFFQMQGDVYLHIQLDPRYAIYVDRGLSGGASEVFGLGHVLPLNGYFKVGRFTPAFGWKFADHTMFTREAWGYSPPAHTDVGLELGFTPGDVSLTLALVNGEAGAVMGADDEPSFIARGESRHELAGFNLAWGGSYLRGATALGDRNLYAAHGYLSRGRLTWLGEWDWTELTPAAGGLVRSLALSQDFSFRLVRGLDLRFAYNHRDPDRDLLSGAETRYGFGFDLMQTRFLGLIGMVNFHAYETGPAVSGEDYAQGLLMLHFFY